MTSPDGLPQDPDHPDPGPRLEFEADLWRSEGPGGWWFVTLPPELAPQLRAALPPGLPGFGSVPCRAECRGVVWTTSAFPDTKRGSYLLPVKAEVRRRLGLAGPARLSVRLTLEG